MSAVENWLSDPPAARVVAVLGGLAGALFCVALVAVLLHAPSGPASQRQSREDPQRPSASTAPGQPAVGGAPTGGAVDVFTLSTGACYVEIDADLGTVKAEQCSQPHDGEIYHRFGVAGGAAPAARFPGEAKVDAASDASCTREFGGFVGVTLENSTFTYLYWSPDEADWANGLRDVLCVVVAGTEGEKLPSSAQSTRR